MSETREKIIVASITILSVCMCAFQLFTAATVPLQAMNQRAVHLTFIFPIIFLYEALKLKKRPALRFACYFAAFLSAASTIYVAIDWMNLQNRTTRLVPADYIFAVILIVAILFLTWRTIGIWMPLIAVLFLAYAFLGPYLPGIFNFAGISIRRLIACLYCGTEGVFGACLGAASTYVFMFVLFGEFLIRYGAGDFFIRLAEVALGGVRGGTGKIAVITSALFGMVSGSPTANVAATGCLTIPMMKKSGYSAEYSGGVVSAAAAGGSIMPPVMGTGAFVMSEIIGVTYGKICVAAMFPAVLYFLALFIMVDVNAAKNGFKGKNERELLSTRQVFRDGWHYLLCITTLIVFLIVLDWSPAKSAVLAILVLILCDALRKLVSGQRLNLVLLKDTLVGACRGAMTVATATACAGIIIGAFTATGLNLRLSTMLIELSGGSTFILLILAAVGALILGMGLPATPVYILMAVMIAPALTRMGIPKLAAHLFVFYFGAMAPITPPVGTAFFVAAGLAKSDPMRTGLVAWYTALVAFLLPFIWVYQPAFLMDGPFLTIVWSVFTGLVGVIALAFGLEGYMLGKLGGLKRIILIAAAIFTVVPEPISTFVGIAAIIVIALSQFVNSKKSS